MYIYLKSMRLWGQDTLFSQFTECSEYRVSLVAQTIKNLSVNAKDVSSIPGLGRFPGEGNGNPLQYSCLGNPKDREAWWATVHGVTKSRTWLRAHRQLPRIQKHQNSWEQTPRPQVLCSLWMRNQWIFQLNHPNLNNVIHYPSLTTEGKMSFPNYQLLTLKHPTSAISLPSTACFPSFLFWEKTHGVWWGQGMDLELLENYSIPKKRERRIWVNQ